MYTRVVRFTGVSGERMKDMIGRIDEAGGPPPGISATGLTVLFDEGQQTAVVLQQFETAADMETAAKVFDAMPAGDTPGVRVSVDACEHVLELTP
jgi:hypothetical protein